MTNAPIVAWQMAMRRQAVHGKPMFLKRMPFAFSTPGAYQGIGDGLESSAMENCSGYRNVAPLGKFLSRLTCLRRLKEYNYL
jgi:hypothetical protein